MNMFHVKHSPPRILLINPWITDFAAYNLWIQPHGILSIASLLRMNGFEVAFIDCLDSTLTTKRYGDGKFCKVEIEKPLPLKWIPRRYGQYGITEQLLREKLSGVRSPNLIGITSGMTYWYPGLFKVIKIVKEFYEKVPIVLGGIYASLCYEHALKYSGADYVIRGRGEAQLFEIIKTLLNIEPPNTSSRPQNNVYPALDLCAKLNYVSVITSRGCPFHCSYCACPILSTEGFQRRDPLQVVEEIAFWTNHYKIRNIVFYDDALLVNPSEHIIVILREIRRRGIDCDFHTPNGLHIRELSREVADLLFHCRFKTIRLGLETSDEAMQGETGGKVDNLSCIEGIKNLKRAGYSDNEIGVYIMAGLPGQRVGEVEESIAFVKEAGAKPMVVEYSPIPHTPLFEKAKIMSKFDLENEPLFQNNSLLPCQWEGFTLQDFQRLKKKVKT